LEWSELPNAVSNEFGGDVRFEILEFVVHGVDGNADFVFMASVGMVDGGGASEDDFEQESHEIGEEEVAFVLFFGGIYEKFVEFFGREESLEDDSHEDGEGGVLFKIVENLVVSVHVDSFQAGRKMGKAGKEE
jgi:hypothetical protein